MVKITENIIQLSTLKDLYDKGFFPVPVSWDSENRVAKQHPKHEANSRPDFSSIERMYNEVFPVSGMALKLFGPKAMFDFDLKNSPDKTIYESWLRIVEASYPDILRKLCIEKTRSAGYHVYFHCDGVKEKTMLARSAEGEELISIYTGGLLSYCDPTPGYGLIHNDFADIEPLTEDEFSFLCEIAIRFNRYIPKPGDYTPGTRTNYPDEHDYLLKHFDRVCPDDLFLNFILEIDLIATNQKRFKDGKTYYYYLRKGSAAKYSAKVCFAPKLLLIFSASFTGFPTYHTRQGKDDKEWNLTPAKLLYYLLEKDWDKTTKRIKELYRLHNIPLPEQMPPPPEYNNENETQRPAGNFSTLEDCEPFRITKEKDIPQPEPTITIAGAAIAAPGNITGISAASKAGKTSVAGVILAGAISKTGEVDGFNEIQVLPNPEGRAVIHFDTEQSAADQQHLFNTTLRRAGFDSTPDYYYSYNIRQLTLENYQPVTDSVCKLTSEKHKGTHLIVIDGGADYLASVNDEEKAYSIVQYFIHLSIKYDCPVIIIVHLNPGSDKERGHFGSEVQRKCYGLLSVTKEGDISTLQPKIMRKAGNGEIPLISFAYAKEKGYHQQVDAPNEGDNKALKERTRLKAIADKVFAPPSSYCHKDAISRIMQETNRGQSTAKTMLSNMDGFGYISKGEDGNYRLNIDKVN
ncbi:MAG: AAA family ATPase [Chitinophagaceae bacterium]|nr:AAA family ATPase [Chitinophagaceae bacterium]